MSISFKSAFALILIFAALNTFADVLGATLPPNSALQGFILNCEGKLPPCWFGIVPEVSTRRDILRITDAHNYAVQKEIYDGSFRVYSDFVPVPGIQSCQLGVGYGLHFEVVDYSLKDCHGIYLGDVINLFGDDTAISFEQGTSGTLTFTNGDFKAVFSFIGGIRPMSPVNGMEIYPASISLTTVFQWHGFAPKERYCQVEPDNPACS